MFSLTKSVLHVRQKYIDIAFSILYNGHGISLKSTGPPSPASASNKLMITAIAASSFPSVAELSDNTSESIRLDKCGGICSVFPPGTSGKKYNYYAKFSSMFVSAQFSD